jgi:hypothetical protein
MLLLLKPDTATLNMVQASLNKISNVYLWKITLKNYVIRAMNELFSIKHVVLDLRNKMNKIGLQFRCVCTGHRSVQKIYVTHPGKFIFVTF